MLHHHDRIRARGNCRAGHDLRCLAGGEHCVSYSAGAYFSGYAEARREGSEIRGSHGVPVAGGSGEWGQVAVGVNVLGQDTAGAFQEVNDFGEARADVRGGALNYAARFVEGEDGAGLGGGARHGKL